MKEKEKRERGKNDNVFNLRNCIFREFFFATPTIVCTRQYVGNFGGKFSRIIGTIIGI